MTVYRLAGILLVVRQEANTKRQENNPSGYIPYAEK